MNVPPRRGRRGCRPPVVGATPPGVKGTAAADPIREAARCDHSATSASTNLGYDTQASVTEKLLDPGAVSTRAAARKSSTD